MIIDAQRAKLSRHVKVCLRCGNSIGLTEEHVQVLWENPTTGWKHRNQVCIMCASASDDPKLREAAGQGSSDAQQSLQAPP